MTNRTIQKKEDILIDQKNRKIAFSSWIPQKTDFQLIVIHGFSEHKQRYADVATQLARAGVASHYMDLPGHGRSDGVRGHIDSFQEYVDNVSLFFKSYPHFLKSKPTFLFGHSLGGLIATIYCSRHQANLKGLILSSPLFGLPLSSILMGKVISMVLGKSRRDVQIPKPTNAAVLSRNPAIWDKYRSDPFRLQTITPSLFSLMDTVSRQAVRSASEITLPLLIFYSMKDKVVSPQSIRQFSRLVGSVDKTEIAFTQAMHELLQEKEANQIVPKMIAWMTERI